MVYIELKLLKLNYIPLFAPISPDPTNSYYDSYYNLQSNMDNYKIS